MRRWRKYFHLILQKHWIGAKKILQDILSPSLFPSKAKQIGNSITSCNKCDICKNFLVSDTKFKCKVTGRVYNIRGKLTCNTHDVVYSISCSNCYDQYVGSVLDFKNRFRIYKSDIKTKKDRCGAARLFKNLFILLFIATVSKFCLYLHL